MTIIGGGPAGASAAISAARDGASVRVYEKSRFPRHKVCGEFLSPGIEPPLELLGVWDRFLAVQPARIHRLILHFGNHAVACRLPEAAFGLSRFVLDQLLLDHAVSLGVEVVREAAAIRPESGLILATGRQSLAPPGRRLFGFKAHFQGPAGDAVELFFFRGCYAGVSAVEGGITNVCGFAPESLLRSVHFRIEELLSGAAALRERLLPLTRSIDWITTGPLVFSHALDRKPAAYLAGDALGFIDPFTGSGLLNAVLTGRLAGRAAARQASVQTHISDCDQALRRVFRTVSMIRPVLRSRWIEELGPLCKLLPLNTLFDITRIHSNYLTR